jgi:hypothetical protein
MTERYKKSEALSAGEHLAILRAKRVGAPRPKFESGDYRKRKVEALKDAGLSEEAAELEEQQERAEPKSVGGHLKAIRRTAAAPGRLPRRL